MAPAARPAPVAGTCVLLGARAVLIRGPSGSGKSTLARHLIETPAPFPFARLVADDQTLVRAAAGRLIASPPQPIAGRLELRGLGLLSLPYEAYARIALVADLVAASEVERLPHAASQQAELMGVALPRLALAARDPLAADLVRRAMAGLAAGGALADFVP